MLEKMISYYQGNPGKYWNAVINHLTISLQVVFAAIIIGVVLGIICAKNEKSAKFISSYVNILRVIPSLALLVIMIPVLGIGRKSAIVALVVIAIPPIMINTAAGLLGIEPNILETAKGMGMNSKQMFFDIELPLAYPLILTGIRTATVETIASASIASYIGAGGLGDLIFTGLGVNKTEIVLLGGLSIAIISIVADLILAIYQSHVVRYMNEI